jgi:hypothetical protein
MRHRFNLCLVGVLATFGVMGCTSGGGPIDHTTIARTPHLGEMDGRPMFQMPISIPRTDILMVPFALQSSKGLFENDDPYSRGGVTFDAMMRRASASIDGYAPGGEVRWHNVLFRDLRSGEEWTLLDRRGIVGRWQMFGRAAQKDQPWSSRGMVFIAVVDDTNLDGSLDDRDARVAILTNPDGRKPRVISPTDAQVWSVSSSETLDAVHLMVAKDTNADGRFDFLDVAVPYTMWLDSEGPAAPTVSPVIQDRVRALLK